MTRPVLSLLLSACVLLPFALSAAESGATPRLAVIKADDVRGLNGKWDRFLAVAQEKQVKVSLGVIGNSLEKQDAAYAAWLRKWAVSGVVEFWHHGWDHRRWEQDGKEISEFGGSGYEHQKEHFAKTQTAAAAVLGQPFDIFGSPFNAMDPDTVRVLNERPEVTLVYCYPNPRLNAQFKGKTLLPMTLRGEHDGTGKPNFEKFKEDYAKKGAAVKFAAIQFHPAAFGDNGLEQFGAIVDFLKSEGWTFVLAREYAKSLAETARPGAPAR